jgi:hypothetical protein
MKASLHAKMQYVAPQPLPSGWPIAPAHYDSKLGVGMVSLKYHDAYIVDLTQLVALATRVESAKAL